MAPRSRGRPRARGRGRGGGSSVPDHSNEELQADVVQQDTQTSEEQAVAGASNVGFNAINAMPRPASEALMQPQQSTIQVDEPSRVKDPHPAPEAQSQTQQQYLTETSQPSSSNPPMSQSQPSRGTRKPAVGPRLSARRSKEERDALNRTEDERRRARELADPGSIGSSSTLGTTAGRGRARGAGDGPRGRGRGRGDFGTGSFVASGPFSAGTVSAELRKRKRGGGVAGGQLRSTPGERVHDEQETTNAEGRRSQASGGVTGRGSESTSKATSKAGSKSKGKARIKQEGPPKTEGEDEDISMLGLPRVKTEDDGGYISSGDDTENEGLRRDVNLIEHIDLVSDEADGSDTPGSKSRDARQLTRALHPVRLPRRDHLAQDAVVKREPSPEPATHSDLAEQMKGNITNGAGEEEPSRRRGNTKGKDVEFVRNERRWQGVYLDEDMDASVKQEPSDEAVDLTSVPPPTVSEQIPKDLPSSPERKKKDGKDATKPRISKSKSSFHTIQDEEEYEREQQDRQTLMQELGQRSILGEATSPEIRDGRVYVFQFPPVIPDLIRSDLEVKQEQSSAEQHGSKDHSAAGSRTDKKPVKSEDADASDARRQSSSQPALSAGIAGKLRVHESGRTTLNWGGTSMELSMGSRLTYLQEVLVIKGLDEEGTSDKEAFGLGSVRGKFIVTPDWEEIIP
ncbi:MAG: hypothetical protein M1821_000345 [Bathelium mastoideum]|nr:MAG: hypothetical protein M1821_000345 [Bathelium mastoideum]